MVTMCGKRRSREGDEGEREGCCPWSDPSPLVPAPRPTCRRRSAPPSFDPPIGRSSPHGWQSGGTALIWAAIRGHVGIVQILCESGADLEAKAVRRGRYGPHSTTAPLRSPLPRLPHCDDDDPPTPRARARARAPSSAQTMVFDISSASRRRYRLQRATISTTWRWCCARRGSASHRDWRAGAIVFVGYAISMMVGVTVSL